MATRIWACGSAFAVAVIIAFACCQTVELEASDCVFDPELGNAGCWRPARGEDSIGVGGLEATAWGPGDHATAQDPGQLGCEEFVKGRSDVELDAAGVSRDQVMQACVRRLSVADQRGFCQGERVAYCPIAQPSYRDACEQQNDAEGRSGCG